MDIFMLAGEVVSLQRFISCGVGTLIGVLLHHCLFIHGEWHVQAPQILISHLIVLFSVNVVNVHRELPFVVYSYILGVLTSIAVYRAFFHPLVHFNGPWYARVSKLWHLWAARNSKNHIVLDRLHDRYGDFVRTGPAEITIFHPAVFGIIDGPQSACVKSEWYDLLYPFRALVTARSKSIHGARRRQWSNCFSTKALVNHGARIFTHIIELDQCIEALARANKPVQIRNMFFWFGFDAMGDFIFSKSFNMLRDQQWHHIIVRLQRAMSLLGPFSPVPWLVQIGFRLAPSIWKLRDWREMVHWCEQQMRSRLLDEKPMQTYHDLAYYLVEAEGEEITDEDLFWLHGDSLLAIVAGSEPTAYALILLFCELAKHPDHIDKLYEELVNLDVTDLNPTILQILSKLPHLNAVINECLRLYPALLTGGARKTLDKGIVVGDTFIPPHTTIVAPRYTISRREDCFHHGNEFIPERWTTSPQMVRNAAAFTPFGTGHHSCLGRGLALDTIRLVTAKLVKKYHFRLAPGENGLGVFSDMKDQFTANPGHLEICFELRKGD